jgi:glycerophosphoryl diester phosphodiesterase
VIFSSFDRATCSALCAAAPELPVGFLCDRALELGPTGVVAAHPWHRLVTRAAATRLRATGLILNTWTVNDPERAVELAALGFDAIITDDVPLVLRALAPREG